jgi:hypothetical protein
MPFADGGFLLAYETSRLTEIFSIGLPSSVTLTNFLSPLPLPPRDSKKPVQSWRVSEGPCRAGIATVGSDTTVGFSLGGASISLRLDCSRCDEM